MGFVGGLRVDREMVLPPGGGVMSERWTLAVRDPEQEQNDGVQLLAAIGAPVGQLPAVMTAMLLAQAVENGLAARDALVGEQAAPQSNGRVG